MVKILVKFIPFLGLNKFSFAQNFESFDYNLTPGAFEILNHFINDTSWLEQLFDHGCWCAKLDPDNSAQISLGGPSTVDELDRICKQWAQARSCTRLNNKSCHNNFGLTTYEVEYVDGIEDAVCPDYLNGDTCLSDTCQIDLDYTKQILAWKTLNQNNWVAEIQTICQPGTAGSGTHTFCDSITTTEGLK